VTIFCFTDNSDLALVKTRGHQYKMAAVKAKQSGDMDSAVKFVKISKVQTISSSKL